MKRFGQLTLGLLMIALGSAATASAQSEHGPWAIQADAAATFGRSSGSAFGGAVDRRLGSNLDLTLEVGRMGNITSKATEERASIIAASINATSNPVQSAIYYDLGLRYHLMPDGKWNPYVALGFGGARIKTGTTFSINGAELTADQLTANRVALGADLDGTIMKPFLTLAAGVGLPLGSKYFLDGSVRYGRVFPRTSQIDGDKANNTLRLQVGIGLRF